MSVAWELWRLAQVIPISFVVPAERPKTLVVVSGKFAAEISPDTTNGSLRKILYDLAMTSIKDEQSHVSDTERGGSADAPADGRTEGKGADDVPVLLGVARSDDQAG